jgi:hypothetical protein
MFEAVSGTSQFSLNEWSVNCAGKLPIFDRFAAMSLRAQFWPVHAGGE